MGYNFVTDCKVLTKKPYYLDLIRPRQKISAHLVGELMEEIFLITNKKTPSLRRVYYHLGSMNQN